MKIITQVGLAIGLTLLTSCASTPQTNQSASIAPTPDQSAVQVQLQARRAIDVPKIIACLTAISPLVEQSTPMLQGVDGFPINGTVKMTVDQTSGQTVVESGDSNNGTQFEFMAGSIGRIDLNVTPEQSSVFQKDASGNTVATSGNDTQIATINFQMENNLRLVNVTVTAPFQNQSGTGAGLTIIAMNCTKERLQQIRAAIDQINQFTAATPTQANQNSAQSNPGAAIFKQTETDGNGVTHTESGFIAAPQNQ